MGFRLPQLSKGQQCSGGCVIVNSTECVVELGVYYTAIHTVCNLVSSTVGHWCIAVQCSSP